MEKGESELEEELERRRRVRAKGKAALGSVSRTRGRDQSAARLKRRGVCACMGATGSSRSTRYSTGREEGRITED